VFLTYWN